MLRLIFKNVFIRKKRGKKVFFSLVFWKHVSAVLALLTFLFLDIFLYIFVQSSVFSFQFLSILKKTLFQSYQRKKKGWNTLKTIINFGCYRVDRKLQKSFTFSEKKIQLKNFKKKKSWIFPFDWFFSEFFVYFLSTFFSRFFYSIFSKFFFQKMRLFLVVDFFWFWE